MEFVCLFVCLVLYFDFGSATYNLIRHSDTAGGDVCPQVLLRTFKEL
jgi:hypothetical protein